MTGGDLGEDRASGTFRCANAARRRDDPALGSAPQVRRWLLLEHPGPWPVDAVAGSGITPEVLALLERTAAAQGARPLLIRRPGRQRVIAERSWAVTYEHGLTQWGTWRHDQDLLVAAAALSAAGPGPGAVPDPVMLVCAHGLHDACCAIRGRPVAAALGEVWPTATWECSHVGGDRFAANVVLLPDGTYYGLLEPESAVDTVREHLQGRVGLAHLRGLSQFAPPVQVAVAAVHERYGPLGARDVALRGVTHTAPGCWQVELSTAVQPGTITVAVRSSRRASAQLTCRAPGATPATQYRVDDLRLSAVPAPPPAPNVAW
ncbi:MAG TPA: sucrase ferredoxin [Propionibacteriaceae bacterium]|nr:sucrase ferredoxin [Propionibacteriaceae bacterium]